MPAVNLGPSNTQTLNITADMTNPLTAGQLGAAPAAAFQTALAVGIANTGTMGANGALTLGTAFGTNQYSAGCYLYFPAGAVASGSLANFYFVKMSSVTAGTVFNNVYIPSNGLPTIPTTLVPVVDAGPGAYTGVTTIQTAFQVTIPANTMGNNGTMQVEAFLSYNNSAGTKTMQGTFGSLIFLNGSPTTNTQTAIYRLICNRGVPNIQVAVNNSNSNAFGTFSGSVGSGTVDTTQPVTLSMTFTLNTATDFVMVEYLRALACYGA